MAPASIEDASGQDGYVQVHFDESPPVAPPPAAPAVAAPPVAPSPAAAATAGLMRWNNASSGFVLRRMAQLLSDVSRPDKVFKDKDVNLVSLLRMGD